MADPQRKTANLFDYSTTEIGDISTTDGSDVEFDSARRSDFIPVQAGVTYTFSGFGTNIRIFEYKPDKTYRNTNYLYTIPVEISRTGYIRIVGGLSDVLPSIMLNEGETTLPYEPYWQHSLRKLTTSTDTITTLPSDLYADGTNATVGLVGNMSQTGTPTPTPPIQPSECGERTGNLWNSLGFSAGAINTSGMHMLSNNYGTSLSTVSGGSVDITQVASGSTTAYQNGFFFIEIDIAQFSLGDNIVISFDYEITNKAGSTSTTVSYVGQGTTGSNVIANWSESGRAIIKATITSAMTKPYVEIRLCGNSIKVRNVQINLGSTAIPYVPYGYKIPISSANTTTPIYLGEVESTRRIRKLVLTGEEINWYYYENATGTVKFFYLVLVRVVGIDLVGLPNTHGYSTHEITQQSGNTLIRIYAVSDSMGNIEEWKSYLAAQYAAGTPVTVWYVLATEETGIVNEPLRKIGDYADEVSGITIPTITGKDSFDVLTTLKPSEVELTYTGWHDASAKEWNGSEWQ